MTVCVSVLKRLCGRDICELASATRAMCVAGVTLQFETRAGRQDNLCLFELCNIICMALALSLCNNYHRLFVVCCCVLFVVGMLFLWGISATELVLLVSLACARVVPLVV